MSVQSSIDSRNSAIHSAYRISLRPSSLPEPRDSSLRVVKRFYNFFIKAMELRVSNDKGSATLPGSYQCPRVNQSFTSSSTHSKFLVFGYRVNDPSAGSPTETLLRLLLPLSDKVH